MKVTIQRGDDKWEFDDGIGSVTVLEHAVESFSNLLKAIYPEDMKDQKLIVLDEDFADDLLSDMNSMDVHEAAHLDEEQQHSDKSNKIGPDQN